MEVSKVQEENKKDVQEFNTEVFIKPVKEEVPVLDFGDDLEDFFANEDGLF